MDPARLPRSVGAFSVNACRNPLCQSFASPPILYAISPALKNGAIKGSGESRSFECDECGQTNRLKNNISLVEEYSRLRSLHRGTKREYCPNSNCMNHRVPMHLAPSSYKTHGKTPKGDSRHQCKACRRTFSIGSPSRRHRESTETTMILKLLVNNMPLRRIVEATGVPADRLYRRIEFLADQCRDFSGHKDRSLKNCFSGRNGVLATDVQTILANWRHADRILNVPIRHVATVDRDSGFVVAMTTDFDSETDPIEVDQAMLSSGCGSLPRAYRKHGRTWGFEEYQDSLVRGISSYLTPQEKLLSSNTFDIPGRGSRIRGDIFQLAHMMLVKHQIGPHYRQILHCFDGDMGLAKLTAAIYPRDVVEGRVNIADISFTKELGNRKRNKLVEQGDIARNADQLELARQMKTAADTYHLTSDTVSLVAARLVSQYIACPTGYRGEDLATNGFIWRYHRKEEPEKVIRLLTDRGNITFGDLAILLTRASMAPVDKYFALARRRIKGFDRGSKPTSGETTWYVNAFYNPEMIEKAATILRFYYNYMLPEAADSGKPKAERRTPAMKIGVAKGLVYARDLLAFN